jgi:hypothetical protein
MREIKFRAWDIPQHFMRFKMSPEEWLVANDSKHFELMQYTGLQDKNGVEIYEGDIVFTPNLDGIQNCPIEYSNGCFGYRAKDGFYSFPMFKDTEVIGNIWQNPELLK